MTTDTDTDTDTTFAAALLTVLEPPAAALQVKAWIDLSVQEHRTIHLGDSDVSDDHRHFLLLECEDTQWTPGLDDYWGTTPSGANWRIQIES